MYSGATVISASIILIAFQSFLPISLDNTEALTAQLDPAGLLFKVYIKVGLFWGGMGEEGMGIRESCIYFLFLFISFPGGSTT